MLPIQKMLISCNYSKGVTINPTYIVVHDTDNVDRGANAVANRGYFADHPEAKASAHYCVDDHSIVQCLEDTWRGWHVGDRYNAKINNSNTIGIETCVNKDGNWELSLKNTLDLVKYLMAKHGIPASNVVTHNIVTSKNCPRKLLNEKGWAWFTSQLNGKAATPVVSTNVTSLPAAKYGEGVYSVSSLAHNVNARVVNDWFKVRDVNGNEIAGRRIDVGDSIVVLDVKASAQLVECIYPTSHGWVHGYIKNVPANIKYIWQGSWKNGSTPEIAFQNSNLTQQIGSLNPGETATVLFRQDSHLCILYNTSAGTNTKSAYVGFNGGFNKF